MLSGRSVQSVALISKAAGHKLCSCRFADRSDSPYPKLKLGRSMKSHSNVSAMFFKSSSGTWSIEIAKIVAIPETRRTLVGQIQNCVI